MTDSQPIRQDGDGLLRDRPLYNFDSVEFVEIKHADWQKILGLARALKELQADIVVLLAAPPQPTPDAMRKDIIRHIAFVLEGHSFALTAGKHHKQIAGQIVDFVVEALSSAPVPPAANAINVVIAEMIGVAARQDDEVFEEWTSENRATIDDWQCRIRDALSSATGVAELDDAWKELRVVVEDSRYSSEAVGITVRNNWARLSAILHVQPGAGEREATIHHVGHMRGSS
jgi:hypothetical protein